jgi:DNA-binding transcriptional regulator YbjK
MTEPAVRATTQQRSRDRQQALADAAAALLIKHGPAAVTHRRVATEAQVPQGSANYYFPSKAVLFAEAVHRAEEMRRDAAQAFASTIPAKSRSAEDTARLLIETFYAPKLEDDVVTTRLEPMLAAYRDPHLRNEMIHFRPGHLEALREVLRRSGRADVAEGPDVDLMAQMIDASLLYAALSGDSDPVAAAARSVGRLLTLASTTT